MHSRTMAELKTAPLLYPTV